MKKTIDGKEINPRVYYYLLDWNDQDNHKYTMELFNKPAVSMLTYDEICQLFNHATLSDFPDAFKL